MNQTVELTRNIMALLTEIQPELNRKGMQSELAMIGRAKEAVGQIAFALMPIAPDFERVMAGKKRDTMATLEMIRARMDFEWDQDTPELNDETLYWLSLACESYVKNCREYLQYRQSFNETRG